MLGAVILGIGDDDVFDGGSVIGAMVGVVLLLGLLHAYRDHEHTQHRFGT